MREGSYRKALRIAYNTGMTEGMKKCKYCGKEISQDTNFCWFCGRELEARPERPEVPEPHSPPNRWVIIALGAIVFLALAYFLASSYGLL
jgi:hypothetical protein